MCETCGCGDAERVSVELHEKILGRHDRVAAHNRAHFGAHGILAINLMGSPGAGKTALLEATARAVPGLRLAAVSGDLATDHDAQRLRAAGIPRARSRRDRPATSMLTWCTMRCTTCRAGPAARGGKRRSRDRPRRAAPPRGGNPRALDHDGIGLPPRC